MTAYDGLLLIIYPSLSSSTLVGLYDTNDMASLLEPDHPDTINALWNLAITLHSRGLHTEAERMMRQSLGKQSVLLGSNHPATDFVLSNPSWVLYLSERCDEAERIMNQAVKFWEKTLGTDHPDLVGARQALI